MRVAPRIVLSKQEQRTLEKWASTRSTSVRMRERARIVLMAAEGMTNKAIAAQLGMDTNKVVAIRACDGSTAPTTRRIERKRRAFFSNWSQFLRCIWRGLSITYNGRASIISIGGYCVQWSCCDAAAWRWDARLMIRP